MFMSHKLWKSDFQPNSAKKNSRQSTILVPIHLKFCTLIESMTAYKFPIHYVYKLWSGVTQIMKVMIFGEIQQKDGCQSAIFDPISLKFGTLIHSMIVYKFPIHYVYKLWSWVTQIMKVLIFDQIQKEKWPPIGHLGSDQSQILHTDTFSDYLQVSYSLCI